MGERHRRRAVLAQEKRLNLLLKHGAFCKHCGKESDLEFDCIVPCGDKHHKMSSIDRARFYEKQDKANNIQVLCQKCNAKKSLNERPDESDVPF